MHIHGDTHAATTRPLRPPLSGRARRLPPPPLQSHAPVPSGADEAIGLQREPDREDHRAHKHGCVDVGHCLAPSVPPGSVVGYGFGRVAGRRHCRGCRLGQQGRRVGIVYGFVRNPSAYLPGRVIDRPKRRWRVYQRGHDRCWNVAAKHHTCRGVTDAKPAGSAAMALSSAAVRRAWRAGLPDPG